MKIQKLISLLATVTLLLTSQTPQSVNASIEYSIVSPGTLDVTFDSDGLATTDIGSYADEATATAIQTDGKIVVTGNFSNPGWRDFFVARYNDDGSLDTSFDSDGIATTSFVNGDDGAGALAIQADGKIVIAGYATYTGTERSETQFAIARYNSDGSLDTSFDTDGKTTTNLGNGYDTLTDLAIQTDGKIIAIGYTEVGINDSDIAVVRYNSDGSLDTTFDSDGIVTTSIGSGWSKGASVVIQPDNKILVGGNTSGDFALLRYNPDGSLDTSFDTDGIITKDFVVGVQSGGYIALQPDGKIIIAGSGGYFLVARYNNNGSPDTSFGTDGFVATLFSGSSDDTVQGIVLQPDGKIILAGYTRFAFGSSSFDFAMARFNTNGSLDANFDGDGKVVTDFGSNQDDIGNSVAIQANGNIVVAGNRYIGDYTGSTNHAVAVARYIGDEYVPLGNIKYVDDNSTCASSCGGSWATAYPKLQDALAAAVNGDQIWVAAGTYYPDEGATQTNGSRTSTFTLKNGVSIYGGFIGTEVNLNDRNIATNITYLSGDLNQNDSGFTNNGENSFNVVTGSGTDNTAILDGFIVRGGNANLYPHATGGGMYNNSGNPTLANITFNNNYTASDGGGIYNINSHPQLVNIMFSQNAADDGGGIYNDNSNPQLTNVTFNGNIANRGGGMHNYVSNPILTQTTFNNNTASNYGGGMYNYQSSPMLIDITFNNNTATNYYGGGIYCEYGGIPNLTNVVFSGNSAKRGGGLYSYINCNPLLMDVIFSKNIAVDEGGGIHNSGNNLSITNTTFDQNQSTNSGGGIYTIPLTILTIKNSAFNQNSSAFGGGISSGGTITITNSVFSGNQALNSRGGAIYANNISSTNITNSIFNQNKAEGLSGEGGAIANIGNLTVNSSEFTQNTSTNSGGAIVNSTGGTASVTNSTISGNSSADGGGITIADTTTVTTVTNTTVSGNSGGGLVILGGTIHLRNSIFANSTGQPDCYKSGGNISTNLNMLIENNATGINSCGTPLLTSDPKLGLLNNNGGSTQTMALLSGSPAIDTGNDTVCTASPVSNSSQNGVTRPQGSHCDIGAYEFVSSGPTTVDVMIAGTSQGSYPMVPETSQVLKYALDGGPVEISSNNGVGIIASLNQWRRPSPTGGWTGVAQSMALPVSQISNSYVIPRYNGTDPSLYNAVLMANVDTVPRTITVTIGGTTMGSYLLGPSDSRFEVYNVTGGPLVVSSVAGSKIVASLYELKRAGASGEYNGQSEMMGLPSIQVSDKYLIPIYFGMWGGYLDASIAFANVDTIATTVDVKIAGVSRGTYLMQPSTSMVVKYLLDGGPVEISSNNGADIVASLNQWRRPTPSGGWTGVAQSMALPMGQISNSYVIPRYNGTDPSLYNAVLMANVDTVPRTITVEIGGAVMGSYLLGPSDSRFEVYNVVGGPLVVSSDVGAKIVASLYELKRAGGAGEYNGQSEMMGLTSSLLSDKYLIPIYFGMWPGYLDASLYIGVP